MKSAVVRDPLRGLSQRSNEVKITERAFRLELSLQHRPDAILNIGGLLPDAKPEHQYVISFFELSCNERRTRILIKMKSTNF